MLEEKSRRRLHKRMQFRSDKSPRNIQPPSKLPPTHLNNQSWFNQTFFQGVSLQSLHSCLLIQKKTRTSQKWICLTTPLQHFAAAPVKLLPKTENKTCYATKTRKRKQVMTHDEFLKNDKLIPKLCTQTNHAFLASKTFLRSSWGHSPHAK